MQMEHSTWTTEIYYLRNENKHTWFSQKLIILTRLIGISTKVKINFNFVNTGDREIGSLGNFQWQSAYYGIKKIFRDTLIRSTLFSTHFIVYILKELSYTNFTSIGLLQKQNGFVKIGRSVHFVLNFHARA